MANKVASGFIIFRKLCGNNEYLLLQASNFEHHWAPPKGYGDTGESEFETAVRETKEETGIDVSQLSVIESFKRELRYEAFGEMKRVVYWLAELKDPNTPVKISHEHQAVTWAKFEDVCNILQYKDIRQIYREAEQFIQSS